CALPEGHGEVDGALHHHDRALAIINHLEIELGITPAGHRGKGFDLELPLARASLGPELTSAHPQNADRPIARRALVPSREDPDRGLLVQGDRRAGPE